MFFVISGFLITSHLMREAKRDGTVSLRAFWMRRIRRLLPASLLVLVACGLATLVWVFPTQWETTARGLIASALYLQNWELAAASVDYLAQGDAPTIVQHYWSLSVEEQFYVLWPLLLVGALALQRRFRADLHRTKTAAFVVTLVGATSFALSVVMTEREPAWAYFATPTRIWELALGAGLALVTIRLAKVPRIVLGWLGIAAILLSAWTFGDVPFPGWSATIPTLGAVAVIAAGNTQSRLGADWWLSLRPATFLGDLSYSIYLWHWPAIVLAPTVLARAATLPDKLIVLGLVLLLSWATKVLVEDRYRRPRADSTGIARTYVAAAAGMVVVVALGLGIRIQLDARVEAAAEVAASLPPECIGPGALAEPQRCGGVMGASLLLVSPPEAVSLQNKQPTYPGCQQSGQGSEIVTCELGADDPNAPLIMLVGDSHGTQWFPSLDLLGREYGFRVETYTKSSCPPTAAKRVVPDEHNPANLSSCRAWMADVDERVIAEQPALVVVTAYSSAYSYSVPDDQLLGPPSALADDTGVAGYAQLWQRWLDQNIDVAVIAAIPRTQGENVPDCLAGHPSDFAACATERNVALPPDPLVAAAELVGADLVDLSNQFCDEIVCYPVVGNVVVYRDYSHLSEEYSLALAPYLEAGLRELPSSAETP